MILKSSIDKVIEIARIDEVVADYVSLKKRGSNLMGLCPFHNEKSPSFTVSPAKGFYKCFGCGKAGDSIRFVMDYEHVSYPDAIRQLAKKYQIELEETTVTDTEKLAETARENMFTVTAFAQKFYHQYLLDSEAGKAVAQTYFAERGFTDATIKKFQLGFAPEGWQQFTQEALQQQYSLPYLISTGLTIEKEGKHYDRFRDRVIFPIHNVTGRTIGFGARYLKPQTNAPKYLNSPESDIYNKSKVLYGIHHAKKSIIQNDNCYLCEGYTDVISLSQAGIENVVASSGTSLTVDQIKLISRFTKNITVLYDGDAAGIKASMRGIDLILQEGLNVRVVLFPDGDDPDSFAKRVTTETLQTYLNAEAKDFMLFKTSLLLAENNNDPIGKAKLIRNIVETIAIIPDAIIRSTYTKQCATLMDMAEAILIQEVNSIRRKTVTSQPAVELEIPIEEIIKPETTIQRNRYFEEEEAIRLLLNYAYHILQIATETETVSITVKDFMIAELEQDGIKFENEIFAQIFANLYIEES
ncbi:MAG TPA: DNA primase, partial [Bacteroidia bacterium]|nr:DNA primase [Bacteroidia bacterium]